MALIPLEFFTPLIFRIRHQVVNLEPTVSITQNLTNERNLDASVESLVREGNSDLLDRLQQRLKFTNPGVYNMSQKYRTAVEGLPCDTW